MARKIISERMIPGKFHEIVYSDGFVQIEYSNGEKERMQEWDNLGNLKSITTYTDGHLKSHIVYDLIDGHKTSEMHIIDGVKSTDFFKKGVPTFTLTEFPDGRINYISHQKVKKQTKLKLLSLLQKSRN